VKGEQIDAWYAGKTHDFGGNIHILFEPDGFPIWSSDVEPGGVADIVAAREHVFPAAYPHTKTMPILADPGYHGAGHGVFVPFKHPRTAKNSASTTAPTTPCNGRCAASANAAYCHLQLRLHLVALNISLWL
jgi:hypothetical protein